MGVEIGEPAFEISTSIVRRRLELLGEGVALPLGLSVLRRGENHLMDDGEPVRLHEHVLRPVESDSLGAELAGARGISRIVGVGPHLEGPNFIGPREEILEIDFPIKVRLERPDGSGEDLSRTPVDGEALAPSDRLVADPELRGVVVDLDFLAARDAGNPEASRDHRRVAGRPSAGRQDAFRVKDPVDIVRRGLDPDQDHGLPFVPTQLLRLVGIEDDDPRGGARGRVQPFRKEVTGSLRL